MTSPMRALDTRTTTSSPLATHFKVLPATTNSIAPPHLQHYIAGNYSAVNISFQPVGLAMSDGMGPISFGSGYVDCYGRGVCDKNTLKCHCHQGFFGESAAHCD